MLEERGPKNTTHHFGENLFGTNLKRNSSITIIPNKLNAIVHFVEYFLVLCPPAAPVPRRAAT